jgi:cytochrome P450
MASAPGYRLWLPLPVGVLGEAVRTPLEFQVRARAKFGDVVRLQLGPFMTHFLYHPGHISRVLRDQQKNYVRGWHYNLLRKLFGEGLVASEGEYWRRQRRLAQPAFSPQRMTGYAEVMIALSPYITRRHPDFWEQPDVFDLDRFAVERAAARPKGAYFPFITGPHQCIGNEFAMMEMTLVVAAMLQRFDFDLLPDQTIRPTAALTLNPSGPIRISFRPRAA